MASRRLAMTSDDDAKTSELAAAPSVLPAGMRMRIVTIWAFCSCCGRPCYANGLSRTMSRSMHHAGFARYSPCSQHQALRVASSIAAVTIIACNRAAAVQRGLPAPDPVANASPASAPTSPR
jgi:hypothetical protein